MPYAIEQTGPNEWSIRNKNTGKVVGRSKSKKEAEASVRARMAAEMGDEMPMKGDMK